VTNETDYYIAIALARSAARRMLEAEADLGRHVTEAGGFDHIEQIARDVGVRRGVITNAALRASGAIRSHRPLEREVTPQRRLVRSR
jgi:hypothetical protein